MKRMRRNPAAAKTKAKREHPRRMRHRSPLRVTSKNLERAAMMMAARTSQRRIRDQMTANRETAKNRKALKILKAKARETSRMVRTFKN